MRPAFIEAQVHLALALNASEGVRIAPRQQPEAMPSFRLYLL
jgi:hypothetical protein